MKALLLVSLLITSTSYADHYTNKEILNCRVTKMIDYTYFEEGLSKDEYPDIDVAQAEDGTYSIGYGSNGPFEAPESSTTLELNDRKEIVVTTVTEHKDVLVLEIERRTTLALAKVKVREEGKNLRTLAYAVCDKGILK